MRRSLEALASGALAGAAAILLHLQLPPFGILLALLGSVATVWAVVQKSHQRRSGFLAAIAWLMVIWRAAIPGAGGELLIQGDLAGEVVALVGSFLVLATAAISQPK